MLARRRDGRPQIVLLDHGLYKRISDDFRRASEAFAHCCAGLQRWRLRCFGPPHVAGRLS